MRKLLFITLGCILIGSLAFAGDSCPSVIKGLHTGSAGWDTYGTCAEWQAAGATNISLYYDYKSPATSLVDGTQAGCEDFATIAANGLAWCPAWSLLILPGLDWSNNNTCPTISGCDGLDDDNLLTGSDRIVLAVYTTGAGSPYTSKFLVDTVAFTAPNYNFDNSIGSGGAGNPHALFDMVKLAVTSATCDGTNCDVVVQITEPTFDATGATGGLYGDGAAIAGNLIAGYKIYGIDSAGPASGLVTGQWDTLAIADQDRYIPANRPAAGGTATSNTITVPVAGFANNLYLAYAPIFNWAGGCAGNPCTQAELAALDTISGSGSLTAKVVSAASTPINPTPVTITSFDGNYLDLQHTALNWVTASETDAAGFNLYRSLDQNNWTQVNTQLIPAKGQGGAGASYDVNDTLPKQRVYKTWHYKIEEITTSGQRAAEAQTTVGR